MENDKSGQVDFYLYLTLSEAAFLRDALEGYWPTIAGRTPYDPITLQELASNPDARMTIDLYSRLVEYINKLQS